MKIVLIGSGNVATHLGISLQEAGHEIVQVFSNTAVNAKELANILKCSYTNKIEKISSESDVYIIDMKDDVVEGFVKKFKRGEKVLIHTSGSVPREVLKVCSNDFGVLYPLQSFNKNREVDMRKVPVFIEANNSRSKKVIKILAKSISEEVFEITSEQRLTLHASAVFVNNFTNHLYKVAEDILRTSGLEFEVLKPLIHETAEKVMSNSPADAQTGPAARKDKKTIVKHLELLKNFPSYKVIYEVLSDNIEKQMK